jgi:hypothetical protein
MRSGCDLSEQSRFSAVVPPNDQESTRRLDALARQRPSPDDGPKTVARGPDKRPQLVSWSRSPIQSKPCLIVESTSNSSTGRSCSNLKARRPNTVLGSNLRSSATGSRCTNRHLREIYPGRRGAVLLMKCAHCEDCGWREPSRRALARGARVHLQRRRSPALSAIRATWSSRRGRRRAPISRLTRKAGGTDKPGMGARIRGSDRPRQARQPGDVHAHRRPEELNRHVEEDHGHSCFIIRTHHIYVNAVIRKW